MDWEAKLDQIIKSGLQQAKEEMRMDDAKPLRRLSSGNLGKSPSKLDLDDDDQSVEGKKPKKAKKQKQKHDSEDPF